MLPVAAGTSAACGCGSTEADTGTRLGADAEVDADVDASVDVDVCAAVDVAADADVPLNGLAELEAQPIIKAIGIKKTHVRMNVGGVRTLTTFILLIFQGREGW